MSTTMHGSKSTAFEWRVESPQGVYSGEQKAILVDKMDQIAERVSHGKAKIEFSFDLGAVVARISAKISPQMRQRAVLRAKETSSSGIQGFVARLLLFWHGLGPDAKTELERLLTEDYLHDEQSKATGELLTSFKQVMAQAGGTGTLVEIPHPSHKS